MASGRCVIVAVMALLLASSTAQKEKVAGDLSTYISEALATFRDIMKNGLPEFGIAPLEPVKLDNMTFNGSGSGVTIDRANFTNATLYGLSTLHVSTVQIKSTTQPNQPMTMILKLKFVNMTLLSNYELSGKIIGFLPLKGNGSMNMELTDVVIEATANLTSNPNGTFTIGPNAMTMDINVDDIKVHFHGLYGGGAMSGFANKIANYFSGRIFNSVKPKLIAKMTTSLRTTINRKLGGIKLL